MVVGVPPDRAEKVVDGERVEQPAQQKEVAASAVLDRLRLGNRTRNPLTIKVRARSVCWSELNPGSSPTRKGSTLAATNRIASSWSAPALIDRLANCNVTPSATVLTYAYSGRCFTTQVCPSMALALVIFPTGGQVPRRTRASASKPRPSSRAPGHRLRNRIAHQIPDHGLEVTIIEMPRRQPGVEPVIPETL